MFDLQPCYGICKNQIGCSQGFRIIGRKKENLSLRDDAQARRLFEYRFQQRFAHAHISKLLEERVAALIRSSKAVKSNVDAITPLRRWNDEGWYVLGDEMRLQAYTKDNQSTPPQEVLDFFRDVEKVPRTQETSEERKDVCLGFCYDPLSGLGALYANHRCRYEGTRVVCQ